VVLLPVSRTQLPPHPDLKVERNREKARRWAREHSEENRARASAWATTHVAERKLYLAGWREKNPDKLRALRLRELETRRERRRLDRPNCTALLCTNKIPLGNKKFCDECSDFYERVS
jgi:hypothetical protein